MTTVASGQNPYGDQSGAAPDWNYQGNLIQQSYNTALTKLQAQREGILQQYGFTGTGNLNDILNGGVSNVAFNPQYQNSVYGQAMTKHGRDLSQLRQQAIMRFGGADQAGLAAQNEAGYQQAAGAENEAIKTDLFNKLTGNVSDAQAALLQRNQQNTDLTNQQGLYNTWAGSHYVSEGGTVADPTDAAVYGNDITTGLGGINFKDNIAAGAGLGRVRDSLKQYLSVAGTQGYSTEQLSQFNAQYRQALRKAGLNPYDAKWAIGNDKFDKDPAKPNKPAATTHHGNYHGFNSKHEYEAWVRKQNERKRRRGKHRAGGGAYAGNEGGGSAAGGA